MEDCHLQKKQPGGESAISLTHSGRVMATQDAVAPVVGRTSHFAIQHEQLNIEIRIDLGYAAEMR